MRALLVLLAMAGSVGGLIGPIAQTPAPAPTAAISGVVTDGITRKPVADAMVALGTVVGEYPKERSVQFTDAKGRFVFTDLPANPDYTVIVAKSGYFVGAYGQRDFEPTFARISVADGGWFSAADVTIWRPGGIAGLVTDERGEPVVGVYVRALAQLQVAGQPQLAAGPLTTTDDRGAYRVGNLYPGRYIVIVPSVQASTPARTSVAGGGSTPGQRPASDPSIDAGANVRLAVGHYPPPPPPVDGRPLTYPPTFSGGATAVGQAAAVDLAAGREFTGLDVRLTPVPASRISGTVQGPPDALSNMTLRLLATGMDGLGTGGETGTALVAPDGSFVFAGVPAGSYTIEAPVAVNEYTTGSSALGMFYGPQLPSASATSTMGSFLGVGPPGAGFSAGSIRNANYYGRTLVTVGGRDESGVVVTLRPPATVSGRLVGEADPAQPAPAGSPRYVSLQTATGSPWLGEPKSVYTRNLAPGEFSIGGVLPGLYLFRGDDATWTIKSVLIDGHDYTYAPLDTSSGQSVSNVLVTFTNAVQLVSGTVRDGAGATDPGTVVIAFPVEHEQWTNYGLSPARIKRARTSNAGSYLLSRMPAGTYYVIALPESQMNAWQDPEFFRRAEGLAKRVTLGWGEKKQQDLKVSNVR